MLFDPTHGVLVAEPPAAGSGHWAGAPGAMWSAGRFFLVYRLRWPRPVRGGELRIATSADGERFETIWSARREDFGALSVERCAIVRVGDELWRLYVSYADRSDGRWCIDVLEAPRPDAFDPGRRRRALGPSDAGVEAVKDSWLRRVGDEWWMFVSCASPVARVTADLHAAGDALSTGYAKSVTGLATSSDGRSWRWRGIVFDASAAGWDRFTTRLTAAVRFGSRWIGLYDGSASLDENYEERCGLAISADLLHWRRLSVRAPAIGASHPGAGSVRYVEAVQGPGWVRFFFECTRPDGSHELRTALVPSP